MNNSLPPSRPLILILLITLTLSRGLIYSSLTPPWWQGHDAEFHFAQIKLLVDRWISNSPHQAHHQFPPVDEIDLQSGS